VTMQKAERSNCSTDVMLNQMFRMGCTSIDRVIMHMHIKLMNTFVNWL